jgi:hypothetical protein
MVSRDEWLRLEISNRESAIAEDSMTDGCGQRAGSDGAQGATQTKNRELWRGSSKPWAGG